MKEILDIYLENQKKIEEFIQETISANVGDLSELKKDNYKKLYDLFIALELVYVADKNTQNKTLQTILKQKATRVKWENQGNTLLKG